MATGTSVNLTIAEEWQALMADNFDWDLVRKMMRFDVITKADYSLTGKPGDKLNVMSYNYIGEAQDLTEGVAMTIDPISTREKISPTIKVVGKAVSQTKYALETNLERYGVMEEAMRQIATAFKEKMDNDIKASLDTTPLVFDNTVTDPADWSTLALGFTPIVKAKSLFVAEDDEEYVLFIHPDQEVDIINDDRFTPAHQLGDNITTTGTIGRIANCTIVKTRAIVKNTTTPLKGFWINYLVKKGAVKVLYKTEMDVTARYEPDTLTYELFANGMYATWLQFGDSCVKMKVGVATDSGTAPTRDNPNEGVAETSNA